MNQLNNCRKQLEMQFSINNIDVMSSQTELEAQEKLNNHVVQIAGTLVGMSVIAIIVGIMGLYSTTNLNIAERSREIGILRSIGCRNHQMIRIYAGEAIITGSIGFIIGIMLTLPTTFLLGGVFGNIFLETGLDVTFSWGSAGGCFLFMLTICIVVSAGLISQQYQKEIRETIAYE